MTTPLPKRTRLLTPNADADGDSTMHSSPSLPEDDEMFPDEAVPQTIAVAANSTSILANSIMGTSAADISPPNSQLQNTTSLAHGVNENGKRPLSQQAAPSSAGAGPGVESSATAATATAGIHTDSETGYTWTKAEEQPGYEWKNTRAREEEARALDTIVDKALQIKSTFESGLIILGLGEKCKC